MSTVNEDWKELKPQIGSFISRLDNLTKGYENIDTLLKKAEKKGYEKGLADTKEDFCNGCVINEFYRKCNGNYRTIDLYLQLSYENRQMVFRLIERLAQMEGFI